MLLSLVLRVYYIKTFKAGGGASTDQNMTSYDIFRRGLQLKYDIITGRGVKEKSIDFLRRGDVGAKGIAKLQIEPNESH